MRWWRYFAPMGVVVLLAACGNAPAGDVPVPRGPSRTLTSQPLAADGALECPATITDQQGMTVPEPPQGAVDGMARLLPDREPVSLVVCSYPVLDIMTGSLTSPFALTKRTVPTAAQRASVVELLTWAPRGDGGAKTCTAMGGNETVHLVGATYGDAIVWVAAKADPNSCSSATNGDFVSSAAVGVVLDEVVGARAPMPQPADPCTQRTFGRLGDDRSLAPPGDPRVVVCRSAVGGEQRATVLDAAQSRQVVTALRGLDTAPSQHMCEGADQSAMDDFRLVLAYAEGPPVVISVTPTCRPPLLSGGLEAADASAVVDLVEQWSPPIPGPDPNGSVSSTNS